METDPLDHRWATRKSAQLNVAIHKGPLEIGNCIAEDVSWGGAFIKTDNTNALQQSDVVELLFHINGNDGGTSYKLEAKVVRCLPEGYGFEFSKFNISTFLKLRKIRKSQNQHALNQQQP